MKKTISSNERLQIIGLVTLARSHAKMIAEIGITLCKTLKIEGDYADKLSDCFWDEENIDAVIKKMGIRVK